MLQRGVVNPIMRHREKQNPRKMQEREKTVEQRRDTKGSINYLEGFLLCKHSFQDGPAFTDIIPTPERTASTAGDLLLLCSLQLFPLLNRCASI